MDSQPIKEEVVHKGLYIAKQRKKGRGGRIKSTSIDNKIQVLNDYELLHQSEVQWVEVRRYDPKEKKQPRNKKKFEEKKEDPKKKLKYVLKKENVQEEKKEGKEKSQVEQPSTDRDQSREIQEKPERSGKQSDSEESQKKQQKKQIVIVGKVIKQINNPFWNKEFVGILSFSKIDKKKIEKYKPKEGQTHFQRIIKDFYLDAVPIHQKLPQLQLEKTQETINLFENYIKQSIEIDETQKGGFIRNHILNQLEQLYVLIKFSKWNKGMLMGKLIKIIGKAKTINGECNCFLYEHGLDNFEHKINTKQSQKQIVLNPSQFHKKSNRLIFTIDPPTSKDLDDALSVEQVKEGIYSIGIHISDVTSYLHLIERQEIKKRTTSVYLPHIVYHMLPSEMMKICSLDPLVERLAFTIYTQMNMKGEIVGETSFEKSIIKSRYKLSYDVVQNIITGKTTYDDFNELYPSTQDQFQELVKKIGKLTEIGLAHRKKRLLFQVFENRELKFALDENKWPIQCVIENRFTAQKIVEEFMIIGNIQAGKKMSQHCPENAVVIHHPKPTPLSIKYFKEYFQNIEIQFKFQNILQLQEQLIKVSKLQIPQQIKLLCYFKARRMQETAGYKLYSQIQHEQNQQQTIHFALGLQHYAHFTSPMRRMADILVHEVLNSYLFSEKPPEISKEELQKINEGRTHTKRLKRDLNQIYMCLMFYKKKGSIECEGIVVSFGKKSISLYIPMFQLMKEVMWDEMEIWKVNRNYKDQIVVCIHYDKKDARKDVNWHPKKFQKISLILTCTEECPLRLAMDFQVKTNKGTKKIYRYKN